MSAFLPLPAFPTWQVGLERLLCRVVLVEFDIRHLYISSGHNFFGHHGKEPSDHPIQEVDHIDCVAGQGIKGDRFFGHRENYKGQITFFAEEVYDELCIKLGIWNRPPGVLRRNVITRGVALNDLIGQTFEVQGVQFFGREESRPCYWMDRAFGPGAEAALKGKGGLRASIVRDGILQKTRNAECESRNGSVA
jgi:MOSC domain-containing protein YiiM